MNLQAAVYYYCACTHYLPSHKKKFTEGFIYKCNVLRGKFKVCGRQTETEGENQGVDVI